MREGRQNCDNVVAPTPRSVSSLSAFAFDRQRGINGLTAFNPRHAACVLTGVFGGFPAKLLFRAHQILWSDTALVRTDP